jgi:transposase-like protein
MVQAVRHGASMRQVADQFGVATVQRWVARAGEQRLDRVDWSDLPAACPPPSIARNAREDQVLTIRQELRDTSDLGEFGAAAIHREWLARSLPDPPSVRTIGLILERRGALDRLRRTRRPPPPPGWYLPPVADGRKGEWCSYGVATDKGRYSCWAEPLPWIRCGSIAWSVPMWF